VRKLQYTFRETNRSNHQQIQEERVAVKIRMKMMGRKHRPYFRICAVDSRKPRDGRVLEELGTYDPMVSDTDARALLKPERIDYWLGVGAQPSLRVSTLIKKYGSKGTHLEAQRAARERLAMPKVVPDAGEPVYIPPAPGEAAPAEAAATASADGEGASGSESAEEPANVSE
jgi:small subunit ribosomal protein S16